MRKPQWADFAADDDQKSAILCATNGEVFRVSEYLNEVGIRHAVRRHAQDFGAAKWIAPTLRNLEGPLVTRSEVEDELVRMLDEHEAEDNWYLLKAAEGDSRNHSQLNLRKIRAMIRSGAVSLTLTEPDGSNLIVSTVHRAKGLEFDRVFLIDPSFTWKDTDIWEGIRARYVALSRARHEIYAGCLTKTRSIFDDKYPARGRLCERVWTGGRGKGKRTKAMEFCYGDVEAATPVDTGEGGASELQSALCDGELIGMPVAAHLDRALSTHETPVYSLVTYDGRTVGRTSRSFAEAFTQAFRLRHDQQVGLLTGLSLVSVETVAGEPRHTEQAGIGKSGMWLVPRIIGLAKPDWTTLESTS